MIVQVRDWRRRSDARAMATWGDHPEPIASRWSIHKPEAGPCRQYAVVQDGATVGRVSLYGLTPSEGWIGIWLAPAACGQGVGTESMRQAAALAFGGLAIQRLRLAVAVANERARRCYIRLGFEHYAEEWRHIGEYSERYSLMCLERSMHASGFVGSVSAGFGAAAR